MAIGGNKKTSYYHPFLSVYQQLTICVADVTLKKKNFFLHILQNHIHHCVQIAFIILKQHMILLEFTFLKWIL